MTGIFDFKNNINYRHDVKKSDYLTLGPSAASVIYMNQSGEIRFQLSQDSSCLNIGDAEMVFTVEIQGLEVDEDLTLEHNFFPKLFSQMRLNLGGTDVEIISNPGDVSSLLSFVLYDENVKNTYGGMMGWIPDKDEGDTANSGFKRRKKTYNKKKVYRGYFELKNIFGFLQSYNRVTYLLNIEFGLTRNGNNDKEIFFGKEKVVGTPSKAKLLIKDLELRIPQLRLNPELEVNILKQLRSMEKIDVSYLKRITNVLDIPEGSNFTWAPSNLSYRPRFLILGFKNDVVSYTENNSRFIQEKGGKRLTSLQIELRNVLYPASPMTFDMLKNDNVFPYSHYIKLCQTFGNQPQLDHLDFMNLYTIFCFDFTAQEIEETYEKSEIGIRDGKMINVL